MDKEKMRNLVVKLVNNGDWHLLLPAKEDLTLEELIEDNTSVMKDILKLIDIIL